MTKINSTITKPASKFTGKDFLDLLNLRKWKWDHNATISRMRPDLDMVSKESLQNANFIPPLSEVQKASILFSSNNDPHYCVWFSGYGAVPRSLLPNLREICEMMAFAESLKEMDKWLTHNCDSEFQPFLAWFQTILQHQSGISEYIFKPDDSPHQIHIREIFCLKNEDYLNDEVIKVIFSMFDRHYSPEYLYIAPCAMQNWLDHCDSGSSKSGKSVWFAEDFGGESVRLKVVLKVFSLVLINKNHWGLLMVDFKEKAVYFGDSLDCGKMRIPKKVKKVIWRWLERIGEDINS